MSFYIVEKKEQLENLVPQESCFIYLVPLNLNYHPSLTSPSLIYYRGLTGKGYIICLNHSESFNLDLKDIIIFLKQHKNIYTLDSKRHSYYLDELTLNDINFNEYIDSSQFDTKCHNYYYSKHRHHAEIEKIIPISKQFEKYEKLYESIKAHNFTRNRVYDTMRTTVFRIIESNGIQLDTNIFFKNFEPTHEAASIKNSVLYNSYNLYNTTTRPTNTFNGINLLAIPKSQRNAFIPQNDMFVEFDYEGYHPRLIAHKINYKFDVNTPVYEQLAMLYFNEVNEENIKYAKEYTFRQLYGGIEDKYKDIEYFKKINEWVEKEWHDYKTNGYITLVKDLDIRVSEPGLTRNQVFNYIVQAKETYNNVLTLFKVLSILESCKTKLVLYSYDAFLFDVNKDEKHIMNIIKDVISNIFPVRISYGSNYRDMVRLQNL